MSGHYKFDARDEKLDEVQLVTNDIYDELPNKDEKTVYISSETSKLPVITIILQIVMLALLIVIIGVAAYIVIQGNSASVGNTPTSDTLTSTSGSNQCSCNSTQITELLNAVQDVHQQTIYNSTNVLAQLLNQQTIYNQNNTDILAQLLRAAISEQNNTGDAIIQLLQNIHTDQMMFTQNNTDIQNLILQYSENSLQKLINIVGSLSNLKSTSISSAAVIDDILLVVEELLQLQNASILFNSITPVSCKDIKTALPSSPTGYYHVNSRNIYCNMGELCGSGGGWTRLAYLDMTDSTENCPTGFRLYQSGAVRACGRQYSGGASCTSPVKFPTNGIGYSEVCGRVTGYQYGTPDAVNTYFVPISAHNDINSYYVDGVSITRGSPRQHVWTFMGGYSDTYYQQWNCPCSNPPGGSQQIQSFVGSNYYCESGNHNAGAWGSYLYTTDPLWDGQGCGPQEGGCCSASGLPWFHRDYGTNTTTDYLELRVCGDQRTPDEDVPVSFYEIYVK